MLKEIFIENYKSLKNSKVEFNEGLNIIIGKNGSGKSNLLEFIESHANISPLLSLDQKARFSSDYHYTYSYIENEKKNEIVFDVKSTYISEDNKVKQLYNIKISQHYEENPIPFTLQHLTIGDKVDWATLNKLINDLKPIGTYNIRLINYNIPSNLLWLERAATFTINKNGTPFYFLEHSLDEFSFTSMFGYLFEHKLNYEKNSLQVDYVSNNIKSLLFEIFNEFKKEQNIDTNLNKFSPIEELRIGSNVNVYIIDEKILIENLTFEFKINSNWVPWNYLSDGTKRLFYLITEIGVQTDGLILIEEPELGIHPHQLFKLMQFIKEQSEKKQIILSTHSPIVLDCLDPNELDRITVAKIENGSSQFYKLTEEQKNKATRYIKEVGELSYYWLHSDLENEED